MVDDFDVVLHDDDPDEEERDRPPSPRDPEEAEEWRSDFRSYLDDPA